MKKLAEQINTLNESLAEQRPVEISEALDRSIADLRAQKYKANYIQRVDIYSFIEKL